MTGLARRRRRPHVWKFVPIMRCFLVLLCFPTLLVAFRAPLGSRRLFRQVSMSTAPEATTASDTPKGPPPFCVNCVHFLPYDNKPGNIDLAKCAALPKPAEAAVAYRVSGVFPPLNHVYCSIAREREDLCGERGSKFKPINAAEEEGDTSP